MKYEDGKYYHVYNRGANKQKIFLSQSNYHLCLRLVGKNIPRYHVSIMAYCLMPNHYHFILRQHENGSISRFIQTTFNAYSQAVNLSTGHSGTLFQGRVKGLEITSDEYAIRLARYIHFNPVAAGLVSKSEAWEFSDYQEWAGIREGRLSDLTLRDAYYNNPQEYKALMDEYIAEEEILNLAIEEE